jgi:hypothetical protein
MSDTFASIMPVSELGHELPFSNTLRPLVTGESDGSVRQPDFITFEPGIAIDYVAMVGQFSLLNMNVMLSEARQRIHQQLEEARQDEG